MKNSRSELKDFKMEGFYSMLAKRLLILFWWPLQVIIIINRGESGKNKPADYNLEDTKIFSGKIIYGIFNVLLAEQVHDWITKEPSDAH